MTQHHPMDHVNGFQDQVGDVTKMMYYTTFTYTCRDVILLAAFDVYDFTNKAIQVKLTSQFVLR